MVLEREIYPYLQWLLWGTGGSNFGALPRFFAVCAGFAVLAILLGYVVSLLRAERRGGFFTGLLQAGDRVFKTLKSGIAELAATSPRRVWALAKLAMKEAWRRRILIALVVYVVLLLFAAWFLSVEHPDPARLYLSFVLSATTGLVLLIALLISAFSLPGDFKSKTIYTVVTKPVRAGEIILGRILGFTVVGTFLLVAMGLCNYVFVTRSLGHVHQVEADSIERQTSTEGEDEGRTGRTTNTAGHRHRIEVDSDNQGIALTENGHYHPLDIDSEGRITVRPAVGFLRARQPDYGKLRFVDRTGVEKARGISVGSEWTYRSFIDGNTLATAIWTFSNISAATFEESRNDQGEASGEVLPIALKVRVFKTHKGTIGQPISGTIQFRNPETTAVSDPEPFYAKDSQIDEMFPSRAQVTPEGEPIDLLDDLTTEDGRLEILVKCAERGQYFGFAQADLYISKPDGSTLMNFIKVHLSIWIQMVIVITVGVVISTLVSGPVAMMFTASFIILGIFREKFLEIATDQAYGGGPAEALVRMGTQANVVSQLDQTWGVMIVQFIDTFISRPLMWGVGQILPDFQYLDSSNYAAEGYNLPWDRIFQDLTICGGYVVAFSVLGYFLLRTREVAR
ncbi:ABC transporter permease [Adhaeretor mobilis]|uniref:ABC-2 family transporter protein n=1 Tax=Adhaeretor mobilis TaxID=1930276 RepID=A0A517MU19_9BACT|nr:ABC transporter permease [Adhaeretor mobilis]QDS98380.1 ABC-2 family transporter protein [Adhaeretor mobilis]